MAAVFDKDVVEGGSLAATTESVAFVTVVVVVEGAVGLDAVVVVVVRRFTGSALLPVLTVEELVLAPLPEAPKIEVEVEVDVLVDGTATWPTLLDEGCDVRNALAAEEVGLVVVVAVAVAVAEDADVKADWVAVAVLLVVELPVAVPPPVPVPVEFVVSFVPVPAPVALALAFALLLRRIFLAARSSRRDLHLLWWFGQSLVWQATLQYLAARQPPHLFRRFSCESIFEHPSASHVFGVDRLRFGGRDAV